MKIRMKKAIILGISLGIVVILGACTKGVTDKQFEKITEESNGVYTFVDNAEETVMGYQPDVRLEEAMWIKIHEMANTVVIANKKWGHEKITKEKVNELLLEVIVSDYETRDDLILILTEWKKGDFSNSDKHHNFVWDCLEGTIGRARGINWDNVPEWSKD